MNIALPERAIEAKVFSLRSFSARISNLVAAFITWVFPFSLVIYILPLAKTGDAENLPLILSCQCCLPVTASTQVVRPLSETK